MAQMTATPVRTQGFYLQGKWTEEGTLVEICAPYDGAPIAQVFQATRDHAEKAIERSIFTFIVAAEETTRIPGEYLSLDWQQHASGRWGIVRRFPLGPIAGITPFNFPLNLVSHKVAPAIASGCTMILKPAPQTPLSALLLAEAVEQAGLPDGAFNVLPLSNEDASLLVTDDRIKLKVGDPLDESTDLGPLIRESDAIRAAEWIQEAVREGATLLCGGRRQGSMLEPTVLTGTRPEMSVNCREIFAPVVTLEPYDDFSQALRQISESTYGLQAGVFTRDVNGIFQAYEELEVGGVIAGDVPSFRIDHMPYGGVKDSGSGREGLRYAIEEMTEPRLLVMNLR